MNSRRTSTWHTKLVIVPEPKAKCNLKNTTDSNERNKINEMQKEKKYTRMASVTKELLHLKSNIKILYFSLIWSLH